METLIKIAQFFLSLSLLVGIHEFGHFIVAKIFKIRVEKFYIFFDPWFSLFKWRKGETEYGVGWLPLGGYVKIAGMIDESMDKEQMAQPAQPDEFRSKPAWQRLLVMIAGVVMNIILAVIIYCGICYAWGDSYMSNEDAKWGYNFSESAEALGFMDGDKLISLDGVPIDDISEFVPALLITGEDRSVVVERHGRSVSVNLPLDKLVALRQNREFANFMTLRMPFIVDSVANAESPLIKGDQIVAVNYKKIVDFERYASILTNYSGRDINLTVSRAGNMVDVVAPVDSLGKLGVMVFNPYAPRVHHYTLLEAIPAGISKTGEMVSSYWNQLKLFVQPETKMYEEVGGFIAIGSIFPASWDWHVFWLQTAFLSIMLAVMNILPIPGLDGGHTIFTLWEIVTRRKPSEKFLEVVQYIGMILLIALMLYANGSDIIRLFK